MKLSNKAFLICFISTQILTIYGNTNPKTFLVNTKDDERKNKSHSSKKGADYDGATEECSSKDIKRPLAFVMDTTNSVSRYEGSVKELTTTLLDEIVDSGVNIPDWILTKFWDFDCETEGSIEENTELVIQTPDSGAMKEALNDIKIGNPPGADNCDYPERAFQGLLLTLQTIPKYGMIMLLTDTASKNLELFDELVKLRDSKEVLIYVVFTPHYQEEKEDNVFVGDPSWLKYKEISNGKLYDMADYDRDEFLKEIVFSIKEECVPITTPSPKLRPGGGGIEIESCSTSGEGDFPCRNAMDGNTEGRGWTVLFYLLKKGPVTGDFILRKRSTVNQLTIFNANLKKFKCRVQVRGQWTAVKVTEVNSDGWKTTGKDEILLTTQTKELIIKFESVSRCTGVQIIVIKSWDSKDCVINEVIVENVKGGTGKCDSSKCHNYCDGGAGLSCRNCVDTYCPPCNSQCSTGSPRKCSACLKQGGSQKTPEDSGVQHKIAKVGRIAILYCYVLRPDKYEIMWKETTSNTDITKGEELIGRSTYGNRVSVTTKDEGGKKRWNLNIRNIKLEDKGTYECHYVKIGKSKSLGAGVTVKLDVVE